MSNALDFLFRAETLLNRDDPARALPLLAAAERRAPDRFLRAEAAARRAEALRALGRYRGALAAYWRAHRSYRLAGASSERLRALLGASACLRILSRYAEARRMWSAVERQRFFGARVPSRTEIDLEIALVERGLGRHDAARRLLLRCLARFKKTRDAEALQHAWWALAGIERFSGRFPAALRAFERAERLAGKLRDDSARAYALCGQAACHRILGHAGPALEKYRRAHAVFRRLKDPFGQAYGFCGMGNAHRVWGDVRRSLPLYAKSRRLYEKVGDRGSLGFVYWGLGGSYRRLGRFSTAQVSYRRALRLFRSVRDSRGEVLALIGLARSAAEAGHVSQARDLFQRASSWAVRAGLPYERALCLQERARFQNRSSGGLLAPFGIPRGVSRRWKDIP